MNCGKPHARLSNTDWLTDARDAERGMDLVWWDGESVKRAEIIDVDEMNEETMVAIDEHQAHPAKYINAKSTMVVE